MVRRGSSNAGYRQCGDTLFTANGITGAKEMAVERTKIASIKNTQKITNAMEMVAASKMRKAQERMRAARPYASKDAET